MKAGEFLRTIERVKSLTRDFEDLDVRIMIQLPFATVGGRPTVDVKYVGCGFDWERGQLQITPEETLGKPDELFRDRFLELQNQAGALNWENGNLKYENKNLRARIKELENARNR